MSKVLFDGKHEISDDIVIEKMKYFINKANMAFNILQEDKSRSLEIAKELRKELELEYKNNDLNRIRKFYEDHKLFSAFYSPAVRNAFVKTTGVLSYKKLNSFLYDVESYMNFYTPREYR